VELSVSDREALLQAKLVLEHPGVAARAAELLGYPIERALETLPPSAQRVIAAATQTALHLGIRVAVATMDEAPVRSGSSLAWHRWAGGFSGACGGFFGLAALPAELPISTVIILRSIADIARSQGENLESIETRLACIEVLALGGGRQGQETQGAAETGYYAARVGLASSFQRAVEHVAKHGWSNNVAPPVADWLARIAARFSTQVSQNALAKAIPLLSAATGAAINTMFVRHFQDLATAHFTIRRLERLYGADPVKQLYSELHWERTIDAALDA